MNTYIYYTCWAMIVILLAVAVIRPAESAEAKFSTEATVYAGTDQLSPQQRLIACIEALKIGWHEGAEYYCYEEQEPIEGYVTTQEYGLEVRNYE